MDADELIARAAEASAEERPADARKLLSAAIISLREMNAPRALGRALRALGEVERRLPGTDRGLAAYEEAAAIARSEGEPDFLAHTIRHLGDIHRHRGAFDKSAACYDEALAVYRAHPGLPPLDVANAHRAAAVLYEKNGAHEKAQLHWREAKRFYDAAGVDTGSKECDEHIVRDQ